MLGRFVLLYVVLVNIVGVTSMALDKRRAVRRGRRVPERVLLTIGLLGGIAGILTGMAAFHHKTRKPRFILGAMSLLFGYTLLLLCYLSDKT